MTDGAPCTAESSAADGAAQPRRYPTSELLQSQPAPYQPEPERQALLRMLYSNLYEAYPQARAACKGQGVARRLAGALQQAPAAGAAARRQAMPC